MFYSKQIICLKYLLLPVKSILHEPVWAAATRSRRLHILSRIHTVAAISAVVVLRLRHESAVVVLRSRHESTVRVVSISPSSVGGIISVVIFAVHCHL